MEYDVVILADGDFPSHPLPLKVLDEAKCLVCCDNAGRRLIEDKGRIPDAIVGDGDSLPQSFKEKYSAIYHQIDEQDYNDLTKATRYALSLFPEKTLRIAYLGTTGKREDHTLGNISLMSFYRREFSIEPTLITDYGILTAHEGDNTFASFPRQQVSIFNLTCSSLSSENLRWPAYATRELWQGTLNEALSDSFSIHSDGEYLVFRSLHEK